MAEVNDYNYIIISTYNGEYRSHKGDTEELMGKYELFCPISDNALCLGVLENSYYDNLKNNKFCSWWYGSEMRGDCLLLWEGEATHETVKKELDTLINCWKNEDKKKAEAVRDELKGFREYGDKREAERMKHIKKEGRTPLTPNRCTEQEKEKKAEEELTADLMIWRAGGTETADEFFIRVMGEKQAEEQQEQEEAERMRQFKRIEENERTERDKKGLREVLELCEIIKGKFKTEGKKAEFSTFMNDLLNSMNK